MKLPAAPEGGTSAMIPADKPAMIPADKPAMVQAGKSKGGLIRHNCGG